MSDQSPRTAQNPQITEAAVAAYIRRLFGLEARLLSLSEMSSGKGQGMKGFGYGSPLRVVYLVGDERREAVLSTMRGDAYGHQHVWDRAQVLLFQYEAAPRMERHVPVLGVGYVDGIGALRPLEEPSEFFLLSQKADGYDYFRDLDRVRSGEPTPADESMAREIALWLARIHAEKKEDASLYFRRTRELLGSSECVMGLIDEAYPHPYGPFPEDCFIALEKRMVDWVWKLKRYAHRLAVVHGDLHPWNILVRETGSFHVLDRSRGEHGDPADDVASLALNYLLFGLTETDGAISLNPDLEHLYHTFMGTYLEATGDTEMMEVIGPYFTFRALVIASPQWYPGHSPALRAALFRFMAKVLRDDPFDYQTPLPYFQNDPDLPAFTEDVCQLIAQSDCFGCSCCTPGNVPELAWPGSAKAPQGEQDGNS